MGRSPRASNETLIELFLDMIAAERGASANTLDAYRRDLADFSADLDRTGSSASTADSDSAITSAISP
jgi:integrase/recombinase XerD